jgi:hypothetical protein
MAWPPPSSFAPGTQYVYGWPQPDGTVRPMPGVPPYIPNGYGHGAPPAFPIPNMNSAHASPEAPRAERVDEVRRGRSRGHTSFD